MKTLMILLAVTAMLNGCRHMPTRALRAHVDTYNKLHPEKPID